MKTHYVIKLLSLFAIFFGFTFLLPMKRSNNDQFKAPQPKKVIQIDLDLCCPFDFCPNSSNPLPSDHMLKMHLASKHNVCPYCPDLEVFASRDQLRAHCWEKYVKSINPIQNSVSNTMHQMQPHTVNVYNNLNNNIYMNVPQYQPQPVQVTLLCGVAPLASCSTNARTESQVVPANNNNNNNNNILYCQYCDDFSTYDVAALHEHEDNCLCLQDLAGGNW
jgi:hypothetical protein